MGLGSTAKKLQKVASMAEDLYKRMNEVVAQVKDLRTEVENTSDQVDDLERQVAEQRALIEALAAAEGLDVDEILADLEGEAAENESGKGAAETTTDADADDAPAAGTSSEN